MRAILIALLISISLAYTTYDSCIAQPSYGSFEGSCFDCSIQKTEAECSSLPNYCKWVNSTCAPKRISQNDYDYSPTACFYLNLDGGMKAGYNQDKCLPCYTYTTQSECVQGCVWTYNQCYGTTFKYFPTEQECLTLSSTKVMFDYSTDAQTTYVRCFNCLDSLYKTSQLCLVNPQCLWLENKCQPIKSKSLVYSQSNCNALGLKLTFDPKSFTCINCLSLSSADCQKYELICQLSSTNQCTPIVLKNDKLPNDYIQCTQLGFKYTLVDGKCTPCLREFQQGCLKRGTWLSGERIVGARVFDSYYQTVTQCEKVPYFYWDNYTSSCISCVNEYGICTSDSKHCNLTDKCQATQRQNNINYSYCVKKGEEQGYSLDNYCLDCSQLSTKDKCDKLNICSWNDSQMKCLGFRASQISDYSACFSLGPQLGFDRNQPTGSQCIDCSVYSSKNDCNQQNQCFWDKSDEQNQCIPLRFSNPKKQEDCQQFGVNVVFSDKSFRERKRHCLDCNTLSMIECVLTHECSSDLKLLNCFIKP